MKKISLVAVLLILTPFVLGANGCEDKRGESRKQGMREQESIMRRAQAKEPVPEIENFLTRQSVKRWVERMDQPAKEWYIYVQADNGQIIHYFVGTTRPIPVSSFLTPPDQVIEGKYTDQGMATAAAPALDGVYYGDGAGDTYFFFDASSDALVHLTGHKLTVLDKPLRIDAPRLVVEAENSSAAE